MLRSRRFLYKTSKTAKLPTVPTLTIKVYRNDSAIVEDRDREASSAYKGETAWIAEEEEETIFVILLVNCTVRFLGCGKIVNIQLTCSITRSWSSIGQGFKIDVALKLVHHRDYCSSGLRSFIRKITERAREVRKSGKN